MADTEMQDVPSGSGADDPGLIDTKKMEKEPSALEKDKKPSKKHKTISLPNVSLSKEVAPIEEVGVQNSANRKNDNVGVGDQSEKRTDGSDVPGLVDTKTIEKEPSELDKDQNLSKKHKSSSLPNVSLPKEVAAIEEVGVQNTADGKNDNVGVFYQSENCSGGSDGHEKTTPKVSNHTKEELSIPQTGGGENEKKWKTWLLSESEEGGIDEAGTPEDQESFIREVKSFYRENSLEFYVPIFYGKPLNCLKLWRCVLKLGGYDVVTTSMLWHQVGESFHPPKTCISAAPRFRFFYEKILLEYEKYLRTNGELNNLHVSTCIPSSSIEEASSHQGSGSDRAPRDSAAHAMQGSDDSILRFLGSGEVTEPIVKGLNSTSKQKNLKSSGLQKQKNTPTSKKKADSSMDLPVSQEEGKQVAVEVVDIGPPADWVKINVIEHKDCFEVYALIPGLLLKEVQILSDRRGRLVISGQPEQLNTPNPWGITPFTKIVKLPARIDSLKTSAETTEHGLWLVRLPFDQLRLL